MMPRHPIIAGPGCDKCKNTGFFMSGRVECRGCPACGRLVDITRPPAPEAIKSVEIPAAPEKPRPLFKEIRSIKLRAERGNADAS